MIHKLQGPGIIWGRKVGGKGRFALRLFFFFFNFVRFLDLTAHVENGRKDGHVRDQDYCLYC